MPPSSLYSVKLGYNQDLDLNPAGAYTDRVPIQPYSPGVQATRRSLMGDGSVLDQGLYVEWIYSVVEDAAQLATILSPLNLHLVKYQPVTIYTRDDMYQYHRYNGMAQRPPGTWENYFARNVVIRICNLKQLFPDD